MDSKARDTGRKTILLASHNRGKAREFDAMLTPLGYRVIGAERLGLDMANAKETADTFAGNSLIKAMYAYRLIKGAYPVMADDSGICFAGLDNFPGVHSARWTVNGDGSYPVKNARILSLLKDNPNRRAVFTCVITLIDGQGTHVFAGEAVGEAAAVPSPARNGFGYDPIFYSPELGKTFADADLAEKDAVSHRGRAVRKLLDYLRQAA